MPMFPKLEIDDNRLVILLSVANEVNRGDPFCCNIELGTIKQEVLSSVQRCTSRALRFTGTQQSLEPKASSHDCGEQPEPDLNLYEVTTSFEVNLNLLTASRYTERYSYTPLSARQIRLLHLAPGKNPDPLKISFTASSIDNLPDYQALSYTWDSPAVKHYVLCDAKIISVTCNLMSALCQLRHESKEQVLWTDALCIDQNDAAERGSQVALMRQIYKDARVVIWLGEDDSHTWEALELLQQLAGLEVYSQRPAPNEQASSNPDTFTMNSILPFAKHPSWKYLEEIFWKPWFFRAWIIQETVLAKTLTIRIGKFTVPWKHFELATKLLGKSVARQSHKIYIGDEWSIVTSPFTNLNDLRVSLLQSQGGSLEKLLVLTNASCATLPVDKVYAIQGLVSERDAPILMPDYSATVEQVFTTVAQSLLHSSLDVLSQVVGPYLRRQTSLPTWVPDWSTSFRAKPFLHLESSKSLFRACGNTTHRASFSSGDKLVAKGILIDKIKMVGLPFVPNKKATRVTPLQRAYRAFDRMSSGMELLRIQMTLFLCHLHGWEDVVQSLSSYPTGESVNNAFARTLIAGASIVAEFRNPTARVVVEDAYNYFKYLLTQSISNMQPANMGDVNIKWQEWDDAVVSASKQYMSFLEEAAWGRVFFITERGYMGLGPMSAFAGDEVAVLCGGKTPYILSRDANQKSSNFRLIGEVYIHGLMKGEAFQENKELREIVLI
ncbi:HET-domain-containing protein [Mollisia scopiformis]|uniref:HET-domain-containing protein n=1 Tax=Mollisia scopiformis TaxID=149040 RepID=A0A194XEB0_MOLSC|nr:HET-domain-containing protein [Mollisia scopiformis]KUJ18513.1 HET-domain-containing protein [Mollisia scopiformis]